jgi:hypothetical protein
MKGHEIVGIDGDEMIIDVCLQRSFEVRTGGILKSLSSIENRFLRFDFPFPCHGALRYGHHIQFAC